jgi:hypothetical protein
VTSNAVVAGLFLLLAAANTAVIPVAVLYGLGEPFGIVGPIAIPLAAVGAVAFTVAGALFIREANRVRRARRVGQLMDRMALAF